MKHIILFSQSLDTTLKVQFLKDGPVEYLASKITRRNDISIFVVQSIYGAKIMKTFNNGRQNYPYQKDLYEEDFSDLTTPWKAKMFLKYLISITLKASRDASLGSHPGNGSSQNRLHLLYWKGRTNSMGFSHLAKQVS